MTARETRCEGQPCPADRGRVAAAAMLFAHLLTPLETGGAFDLGSSEAAATDEIASVRR